MSGAPEPNDSPRGRDPVAVAASVLALLSVVAYGIIRISYERFYDQFALAPEDVGATSTRILAESGAHVFVYTFLFAVVPYALTFAVLRAGSSLAPKALSWQRLVLFIASLVPLAVYHELTGGGVVGWYFGVAAVVAGVIAWWTAERDDRRDRWWRSALVWFGSGIFLVNLLYLPSAAERAGRCIANAPKPVALHFVHTRRHLPGMRPPAVLGLRAQPARVTSLGNHELPASLAGRVVYLGQADGTYAFFVDPEQRAVRVPTAAVSVTTQARVPTCDELA
jgi:hypothetical protein